MRELKARFRDGVIEPLEALDLAEGQEITVMIVDHPGGSGISHALKASTGAWLDLVDGEELKKNICDSRLANTRPKPAL